MSWRNWIKQNWTKAGIGVAVWVWAYFDQAMSSQQWKAFGLAIAAWVYLAAVWDHHSTATLDIPERRTLYDFLQTHPYAFLALLIIVGVMIDSFRRNSS
jgi:hypothetical protein